MKVGVVRWASLRGGSVGGTSCEDERFGERRLGVLSVWELVVFSIRLRLLTTAFALVSAISLLVTLDTMTTPWSPRYFLWFRALSGDRWWAVELFQVLAVLNFAILITLRRGF